MYLSGFEVLAFLCENENDDVCDDEKERNHIMMYLHSFSEEGEGV